MKLLSELPFPIYRTDCLLYGVITVALLQMLFIAPQARADAPKAGAAYTLRQENDRWWLTTPAGKPFFSLGVCCVGPGDARAEYNPKNPGYAAFRHYPDNAAWADATLSRLKSWGFTTVGGWSDLDDLRRSPRMDLPYTLVLHMGASAGAPWWDMWDPKVIAAMDEIARKQIEPVRDDPRLLGYYTDNEMGWWNAPLFQMALQEKPGSGQRGELLKLLRRQYGDDWRRLLKDFDPQDADSFAALERGGMLFLRPGGQGVRVVREFAGLLARRYYALCRQIIRKYDPRGLILGDRYQSFYYPEVARACREGVDAVSTNVNPNWNDGALVRFYLDTLHRLTQKPILVGEFYMTATENRSGDNNSSSGFPVVPTQRERAVGFRNTLTAFATTPYVAGADWFQYSDEPGKGRGDGENYDMGLVDVEDRPYEEITAASAAADPTRLHAQTASTRPDVRGGVPPAPANPLAHAQPMEALRAWDRERGFTPCHTSDPTADLYLCWDHDAVYVGLYSMDIVENGFYRDKQIPEIDRAEWTLRPAQGAPIRIRIGAGRPPRVQEAAASAPIEAFDLSGVDHDVRNIAVVRLPAALFGLKELHAGDAIRLSSRLATFARAYRMEWGGAFRLAP